MYTLCWYSGAGKSWFAAYSLAGRQWFSVKCIFYFYEIRLCALGFLAIGCIYILCIILSFDSVRI